MTRKWHENTKYESGDRVVYEEVTYEIIQPHRSQSDWCPPATPALWARVDDDGNCAPKYEHTYDYDHNEGHGGRVPEHSEPQPEVEYEAEEKQTRWQALGEHRQDQIKAAGGIAAGLALLGAGYAVYRHHEKSEEEKDNLDWALSNWLNDSKARTKHCRENSPPGPVYWILNEGTDLPRDACQLGNESDGRPLYASRAFYEGGIHIGKAASHLDKGACVPYGGKEVELGTYEVLCGNPGATRWIQSHGKVNISQLGARPVEGGKEADGTPLLVCRAPHKGSVVPGKTSENQDGALIPYGGDEKVVKEYEVLCYA